MNKDLYQIPECTVVMAFISEEMLVGSIQSDNEGFTPDAEFDSF